MKNKINIPALLVIPLSFALAFSGGAGCGSSSSSGSTSSVSTISDLPKATGPVTGTSSVTPLSRFSFLQRGPLENARATTGVLLSGLDSVSWTSGRSRAMCESGKFIRDAMREAAQADQILCYIGASQKAGIFPGTLDDGNYKYFQLSGIQQGEGGGQSSVTPKVKFKIVKSGTAITQFEMFACFAASGTSSVQDSYVSVNLTDLAAVRGTSVHKRAESNGNTFGGRSELSGAVNSSGVWTSKSITSTVSSVMGQSGFSGSFGGEGTVTQYSDRFEISAYFKGTFSFTQGGSTVSDTFTNLMRGIVQGIGLDSMTTMAIGDGSMKANLSHSRTNGGGGTFTFNDVTSWSGDTQARLTDVTRGDYYSAVLSSTLPTAGTPTVNFATAETWDCAAPAEGFTTTSFSGADSAATIQTEFAACDTKYGFGRENSWIDCNSARESQ